MHRVVWRGGSRGELGAGITCSTCANSESSELEPPSPLSHRGTVKCAARRTVGRTGLRGCRVSRRRRRTVVTLHVVICQAPDCGRAVLLCKWCCDIARARYCNTECARRGRRERQRKAGRQYQQCPRGRRAHAERQMRYRNRKRVTHHLARIRAIPARVDSTTRLNDPTPRCACCGREGVVIG